MLAGIRDRTEICDSRGELIGVFEPYSGRVPGAPYVPSYTEEELQRFDDEPGGKALNEIFAEWLKRK